MTDCYMFRTKRLEQITWTLTKVDKITLHSVLLQQLYIVINGKGGDFMLY